MHLQTVLLAVATLLSTASAERNTKDFTGLGQIRTLYIGRGHDDLGCLTSAGKWTANESLCGTFAAEQISDVTFHLFAPKVGGCGVDVATFKCGDGVKGGIFGTFGNAGPIPGREVLRYGQYGVMATDAEDSPPSLTEDALNIHFYSGSEKGKWVWLGWKPLVDDKSDE